jgi:two-component system, chemotaxis family, chemotaxis protein CheY
MFQLRALVVDDSRVMRAMVMDNLSKAHLADWTFIEAEDGEDALAKFHPKKIDIIFADWNMPKMSGIELVCAVRAMQKTEHIAIVMVTSEKTMSKMEEAFEDGKVNAFISKPFTADYMFQKLQPVIEGLQAGAQKGRGLFNRLGGGA